MHWHPDIYSTHHDRFIHIGAQRKFDLLGQSRHGITCVSGLQLQSQSGLRVKFLMQPFLFSFLALFTVVMLNYTPRWEPCVCLRVITAPSSVE
jgi:hypothetical protein